MRALRYAKAAGEQAESQFAWDEAASHYEAALAVLAEGELPPDLDEAELLTALGRSSLRLARYREAQRALMRAIDLYRSRSDGVGMARAAIQAIWIQGPSRARKGSIAEEALELLGDSDIELEGSLRGFAVNLLDGERGEENARRAAQLAAELELTVIEGQLAERRAILALERGAVRESREEYLRSHELLDAAGERRVAGFARQSAYLRGWHYQDDTALAEENLDYARRYGERLQEEVALSMLGQSAILRGELDRARAYLGQMPGATAWAGGMAALPASIAGDSDRASSLIPPVVPGVEAHLQALRGVILANVGRLDDAETEIERFADSFANIDRLGERFNSLGFLLFAGGLHHVSPATAARPVHDFLAEDRWGEIRRLDSVRAAMALRLGDVDEAEWVYRRQLEWTEELGYHLHSGLCHQGLAEVSERRGDHALAMQHLDAAGELFSRHGAKLYLDQVLAKKEFLRA